MSRSYRQLGALAEDLTRSGADPERLAIVRCALNFKRAWVDLAQALARLQASRAFARWGFDDLHSYCGAELQIKPATVDKLLWSLSTVRTYAPDVLDDRADPARVPSLDAVEYFSRAVNATERNRSAEGGEPLRTPDGVVDQLRAAVFDEGRSATELRRQFNPLLWPKSPQEEAQDRVRKTKAAAQRLLELVHGLDFLTEKRVARVDAVLEALQRDLDGHLADSAPSPAPSSQKAAAN